MGACEVAGAFEAVVVTVGSGVAKGSSAYAVFGAGRRVYAG